MHPELRTMIHPQMFLLPPFKPRPPTKRTTSNQDTNPSHKSSKKAKEDVKPDEPFGSHFKLGNLYKGLPVFPTNSPKRKRLTLLKSIFRGRNPFHTPGTFSDR